MCNLGDRSSDNHGDFSFMQRYGLHWSFVFKAINVFASLN